MLFDKILESFAETDAFASDTSPSTFFVYAHENASAGNADHVAAIRLITWLRAIRSKTFSDKSPSLGVRATREEGNLAVHDILSNQFCLLPKRKKPGKVNKISSVDKVIICCSEVLQSYYEDTRMKSYIEGIKDVYFRAERNCQETSVIRQGVLELIKKHHNEEGFHHVLTELSFLEIRSSLGENSHSILPIVLNGDGIKFLPYFKRAEPVWLKAEEYPEMLHPCQMLHKLFFKVLSRVFDDHHQLIDEYKICYQDCVKSLDGSGCLPLKENFEKNILMQIVGTLERLRRQGNADVRHILVKSVLKQGKLTEGSVYKNLITNSF
jgi:hypothetical protein